MFNNILKSDILFKTKNVSVLKPNIKKGVLLYHQINSDFHNALNNVKTKGLKSGAQLRREGVNFGRSVFHDSIFFKAPYVSPTKINYTSIYSELNTLYPDLFDSKFIVDELLNNIVLIRVDPNETFVFSSEIRVNYVEEKEKQNKLNKSRTSLIDYFKVISNNSTPDYQSEKIPVWNLINREIYYFPERYKLSKDFSKYPIERNSEVLIEKDIILPDQIVDII